MREMDGKTACWNCDCDCDDAVLLFLLLPRLKALLRKIERIITCAGKSHHLQLQLQLVGSCCGCRPDPLPLLLLLRNFNLAVLAMAETMVWRSACVHLRKDSSFVV